MPEFGPESNAATVNALRRAAGKVQYTLSESVPVDGLSGPFRAVSVMPARICRLIIVNVVIFAALIVGSVFIVRGYVRALKKKTQPPTK